MGNKELIDIVAAISEIAMPKKNVWWWSDLILIAKKMALQNNNSITIVM